MRKTRADYMTEDQQSRWSAFEKRMGRKMPRTHQNCIEVFGVGRPGKTKKDRAGR